MHVNSIYSLYRVYLNSVCVLISGLVYTELCMHVVHHVVLCKLPYKFYRLLYAVNPGGYSSSQAIWHLVNSILP